ncbi:uncharacterized protein BO80DRAFT_426564 [Aspergillus ibericus CBS 121593]|uniref:Uncharacterized protein n=1 Tax=Aspergillus ibericus CBS 121593 TaxID=1448316 RepID=A0A395GUN6_9EURO|nr:hypothetical protein BO80DRAFT_426564 [Aspergillus ibericus CBS 121593]RAK99270.1 hypothetical protein BO80DRAFT_426564 [Aspergillus ibericus CBS 121593]
MAIHPDFLDRPETRIIRELIDNPNAVPAAVVQQIIQLSQIHVNAGDEEEISSHVYYTSTVVVELTDLVPPSQQTKLVEFLVQLQRIPILDPRTGEEATVIEGLKQWSDLPLFGVHVSDEMNLDYWGPQSPAKL